MPNERPASYCGPKEKTKLNLLSLMGHICKGDFPTGLAAMYLGTPSLALFQAFIIGYIAGSREGEEWHKFDEWVRNKLRFTCYAMHICTWLCREYGGGRKGMAKLVELWREYEKTLRDSGASDSERQEDQEEKAP
jgi:hypothetical protein